MEVCVTNFGGRIVSVMAPDRNGVMRDVVLGFDSIQDYIKYPSDYGASIGRMQTELQTDVLHWTVQLINCHRTITDIVCTVVLRDSSM